MKHKTHLDTVLAYRQRYLHNFDKKETNKRFIQYSEGVRICIDEIRLCLPVSLSVCLSVCLCFFHMATGEITTHRIALFWVPVA